MNPFQMPLSAFAMFQDPNNPYPDPNRLGGGGIVQNPMQQPNPYARQPMPELPQAPQYNPNEPMQAPFGIKMTRGQADYLKDLSAGIGQATDNPFLQAMGYAQQKKDARGAYDAEKAQKGFENQIALRKLGNEEKTANNPKWQLGSMYDNKGNERKIIYDERDPTNYRPLGGAKTDKMSGGPVAIVGKDGKPVYTRPEDAINQTPYERPRAPTPGMSIHTNPDGSIDMSYGDNVTPGVSKTTQPKLEDTINQATTGMANLRQMQSRYDDSLLTFKGQADAAIQNLKEKAGIGLNPDQQKRAGDMAAFQRDVTANLNSTIHALSGAASSVQETERIKQGLPTMDDSPTQFKAKWGATMKDLSRVSARAKWALQNGVGQNPWEADEHFNTVVKQRGDALAQQIKQQNPQASDDQIKAAVTNKMRLEFGF